MVKLEIDDESFATHLLAISFLNEIIIAVNEENTIVLNNKKLHYWLNEIKEKLEEERNARN